MTLETCICLDALDFFVTIVPPQFIQKVYTKVPPSSLSFVSPLLRRSIPFQSLLLITKAGSGHVHDAILDMATGSGSIQSSAMVFPQAWSLSGALQEAQLCLLGKVMGVCAPAEQVRMLDGLKSSVTGKAGKQYGRGDPQQLLQHGIAIRASIAALCGLQVLVDRYKGMPLSRDKCCTTSHFPSLSSAPKVCHHRLRVSSVCACQLLNYDLVIWHKLILRGSLL